MTGGGRMTGGRNALRGKGLPVMPARMVIIRYRASGARAAGAVPVQRSLSGMIGMIGMTGSALRDKGFRPPVMPRGEAG